MEVSFKTFNFHRILYVLIVIIFFSLFSTVQAVETKPSEKKGISNWEEGLDDGAVGATYKKPKTTDNYQNLITYLGGVMNFTGFLALMLMARLIWAGYNWMTAGGNTEQVEGAKKTILHATIGIILLIALYVIAYFVIERITFITNYKDFEL